MILTMLTFEIHARIRKNELSNLKYITIKKLKLDTILREKFLAVYFLFLF